jgi:hypothetical protein
MLVAIRGADITSDDMEDNRMPQADTAGVGVAGTGKSCDIITDKKCSMLLLLEFCFLCSCNVIQFNLNCS